MKNNQLKSLHQQPNRMLFTLALMLSLIAAASAAPGDLDPMFGTGGKIIIVLPDDNRAQKMAIQPDGKIVVQGRGILNGDLSTNFLARYNSNGTLDTGFGTNGTVIIPYAMTFEDFQNGLAILPDGKILVSGDVYNPATGESDFAVFRFNSNGSRDILFGTNGAVNAPVSDNNDDYGYMLQVQPDGKIVVVGFVRKADPNTSDVGIVRFNANGIIDTAFGTNGKLIIAIPTNNGFALAFHFDILPDGKLLLIGRTTEDGFAKKVFLSRINSNGTLDTSFGANGVLLPEFNQLDNYVSEFALQPDGKIVFPTGNFSGGVLQSSTIVRLNPNGTLDASFGTNGSTVIAASEGRFDLSVLIQPNGKILAARQTTGTAPFRFAIVRLNGNGSRDTSFGSNGIVTTLLASFANYVVDMALQPDGKLIAYGPTENSAGDYDIGLARYLLDAPRRAQFDFDGDGKSDIAVYRSGTWYLQRSSAGFAGVAFGAATDIATPADFDGDGHAELAVYRPSNGTWYFYNLAANQTSGTAFGASEDKPVPADYDGDGKTDAAVFRPSNGTWYLQRSMLGFTAIQFGEATDKPVPADYDGDGKADVAVFRPSNGVWYLQRSTAGLASVAFGLGTDVPVPADYDGDGKADIAVFRNGLWYLQQSASGFAGVTFGAASDVPIEAAYVP